jgi:hypothetical protein
MFTKRAANDADWALLYGAGRPLVLVGQSFDPPVNNSRSEDGWYYSPDALVPFGLGAEVDAVYELALRVVAFSTGVALMVAGILLWGREEGMEAKVSSNGVLEQRDLAARPADERDVAGRLLDRQSLGLLFGRGLKLGESYFKYTFSHAC